MELHTNVTLPDKRAVGVDHNFELVAPSFYHFPVFAFLFLRETLMYFNVKLFKFSLMSIVVIV